MAGSDQETLAWVEWWLSSPRFAVYRVAAGGDAQHALDLYEWNTGLGAALMHDLAHLEVGLRNAYDRALGNVPDLPQHWTACGDQIFAPVRRTRRRRTAGGVVRTTVDVNARSRASLEHARREVGWAAPPGKVVAQLSFGFWRYLTSAAHEVTLWRPALHRAFPRGTERRDVDLRIGRLHQLRNRVAHHEPLLTVDVMASAEDARHLAGLLHPRLREHLDRTSTVSEQVECRP